MRRTVAAVFDHAETFIDGMLTVASDTPIEISKTLIGDRLDRPDPFYREVAQLERLARDNGESLADYFDAPRLSFESGEYVITDDHPLVEYPYVVRHLVRDAGEGRLLE